MSFFRNASGNPSSSEEEESSSEEFSEEEQSSSEEFSEEPGFGSSSDSKESDMGVAMRQLFEEFVIEVTISELDCCAFTPTDAKTGGDVTPGDLRPSSRFFSDFKVLKALGYGAFGVVFECEHKIDMLKYVVKRISLEENDKTPMEVVALARLQHQYIVRYHQAWKEPCMKTGLTPDAFREITSPNPKAEYMYIQMQQCSGKLREVEKKMAWKWFLQLLEGIEYVHKKGIFHCDLSVDNIMLDEDDNIRICDFGLAQFSIPDEYQTSISFDLLESLGNPAYRAPELLRKETEEGEEEKVEITQKVDIFSLGMILVDLFGHCMLYMEKDEMIRNLKKHKLLPLPLEEESNDVKQILLLMVDEDPNKRPEASMLLEALASKKEIK